jgi:hypothetical protein
MENIDLLTIMITMLNDGKPGQDVKSLDFEK